MKIVSVGVFTPNHGDIAALNNEKWKNYNEKY